MVFVAAGADGSAAVFFGFRPEVADLEGTSGQLWCPSKLLFQKAL